MNPYPYYTCPVCNNDYILNKDDIFCISNYSYFDELPKQDTIFKVNCPFCHTFIIANNKGEIQRYIYTKESLYVEIDLIKMELFIDDYNYPDDHTIIKTFNNIKDINSFINIYMLFS